MSTELEDDGYDGKGAGPYWQEQIELSKKKYEPWRKRGDEVIARYRAERSKKDTGKSRFNILWSNVQVLTPSLYGRPAKPEVSRRYRDADPVGRLASMMLERVLEYEIEQFPDFDATMKGCVEDRLLPGRGTAWLRYEPVYGQETPAEGVEPIEVVDQAHSPVEYVYWKDFHHSPARTWEEVWWVARCSYMTRDEGEKRFGPTFTNVQLSEYEDDPGDHTKNQPTFSKKAKVFEIWNKNTKRVCWIAEGYNQVLDELDDPLKLEGFFPCPKPLFATTTTGSQIPVPDFKEYEDQAIELDDLTARIDSMVAACKANGVYNAEFKEVARLLSLNTDNTLIPVGQWGSLAEKGGLAGAVEMLDLTTVLQALGALYTARESVKVTIYEICGISDIMRSQTKAEETLGAQQLKVNFGSLRLRSSQVDVARFASDIFKLKAQIICQQYPPQLIVEMSGVMQTTDGQDQQKLLAALQLLRDSTVRDFHISVQSDSLAQIDETEEKQKASEFMVAISSFIKEALPMAQSAPETLPMAEGFLKFIVSKYHVGRETEAGIEQTMQLLKQKAMKAAQNPQPSEAEIEAKAKAEEAQLRAQVDAQSAQMKGQIDLAVQTAKLDKEKELESSKMKMEERLAGVEASHKMAIERMKDETERFKVELTTSTQLAIAEISANSQVQTAEKEGESNVEAEKIKRGPATHPKLDQVFEQVQQLLPAVSEIQSKMARRPIGKKVVRGLDDRIERVEDIYEESVN